MKYSRTLALSLAALAAAVPFAVGAQSSGLEDAIRIEIMKDPRTRTIPVDQLEAMVESLTAAAEAQGVTESDITWRPAKTGQDAATALPDNCGFFCAVNAIFGFGGDDYTIPIGLGITSALLILFISMMLHRHHVHGVVPHIDAIHNLPPTAPTKKKAK